MLKGNRITLKSLSVDDVAPRYVEWLNDSAVNQYLESRWVSHDVGSVRAFVKRSIEDANSLFLGIYENQVPRHIGNIKMEIDRHHALGRIGILGERDAWGKGYATEAIELLSEYAFTVCECHKLVASAYDVNLGSVGAFRKAGFVIEGRCESQYRCGDKWVGAVLMGKLRG